MSLSDLLKLLDSLPDRVPIILGYRNDGVEFHLCPDGDGWLEATLIPTALPEATGDDRFHADINSTRADYYFASLSELEEMLNNPVDAKWHLADTKEPRGLTTARPSEQR